MKASTTKTGMEKKIDRVYNSYQYCGLCDQKVSNFAQHIERNKTKPEHTSSAEIKEIHAETDKKKRDKMRTLLRGKFNNKYNLKTLQKGRGEILLERRPQSLFNLQEYGPCPSCLFWMAKKLIRKHQKSCVAKTDSQESKSSAYLVTQSDTISGRIKSVASPSLVNEVFSIMHMDEVGKAVREDSLIIQLGNQWMEKNVANKLKRGPYTSQIIRLVGRLLVNLRSIKTLPDGEEESLWNYLKPSHFDAIVQATLMTAAPDMDDVEDLKKPSNAVKLGFDIKRIINGKIGMSILNDDRVSRTHAEDLLKAMEVYWGTKVTKLARVLLEERHYNKNQKLPEPSDIEKLNRSLSDSISSLDLSVKDFQNFIHVAEVISAKLVLYNRRRTGELQAIRLTDYKQRQTGQNADHLLGQCTAFEKKLLESQEVMTVRGKTGRGVPVILPQETKEALSYLTNADVRKAASISSANGYIFAARGQGVVRAYDALAKACKVADLEAPERITSTSLRKYMATVTQVLDLKEHELQWVLNHLGHTLDVHKIHYRCTSDILERTQIAKILLLQDHDRLGQFRNKSLQEIQLQDIVLEEHSEGGQQSPSEGGQQSPSEGGQQSPSTANLEAMVQGNREIEDPNSYDSVLNEAENFDELSDGYDGTKSRKQRKKPKSSSKVMWTKEEEEEIKALFKNHFEAKRRPKPKECLRAIEKSRKNNGCIAHRKKDVLKKKVFRMIDRL